MSEPLGRAEDFFLPEYDELCSCEGGCKPSVPPLYQVGDFLSDRFVAIRKDLVDPDHPGVIGARTSIDWPIERPDALGDESRDFFQPGRVGPLLRLGIWVGDPSPGGGRRANLWIDGEHIGWLMPTRSKGAQLETVRALMAAIDRRDKWSRALAEEVDLLPYAELDALWRLVAVADSLNRLGLAWVEQPTSRVES